MENDMIRRSAVLELLMKEVKELPVGETPEQNFAIGAVKGCLASLKAKIEKLPAEGKNK